MNKTIQRILEPIYLKLDAHFSGNELIKIQELEGEISKLKNDYNTLDGEYKLLDVKSSLSDSIQTAKIADLNKELNKYIIIPDTYKTLQKHFDTKYPKQKLTYKGTTVVLKDGIEYTPDVFLPDYIYDFQSLRTEMISNGYTFEAYMNKYNDFATAMDNLRYDIYKYFIRLKSYKFDKDLVGQDEYWAGPFISWYLKQKGMDCEDSSLLLMALFKAAGIPRGFQRGVGGMTELGGHCVVHVYNFKKEKWIHYETTVETPYTFETKNSKEAIAISEVWWSFDWEFSWSDNPNMLEEK